MSKNSKDDRRFKQAFCCSIFQPNGEGKKKNITYLRIMYCLKHEQQCFIGIENHEAQPSSFRPDKTRAASFLNGFKNIPGKACVKRVHNNDAFVNGEN